jgi:hemolysin activation/secretion protein
MACLGAVAQAQQRPPPPPRRVLPPVPPSAPEESEQLPLPRVFVRQIRVTGNTVFSDAELAAVTTPYVNRELTTEDLEALRLALTRLYIDKGYINSGAILPDQTVTEGVITLHIIEGELTSIEVEGNRWFRAGYIRRRLSLGVKPPVNIATLQQRLQLLQLDSRIERLHAELRPGVQRGESVLHVRVEETLPFTVALEFNNYRSPTVSAEHGLVTVAHQNLTGHGDILSVTYGITAALKLQIDASYTLPLSARDTTVSLRYRRNDEDVVEVPEAFENFDINTESEVYGITMRHPFYRTLRQEFALALTAERLRSETEQVQEDEAFFISRKSTNTALRFSQEWIDRTQHQVTAARSRVTLGVDVSSRGTLGGEAVGEPIDLGPEVSSRVFVAWLGQFQWVRRLGARDIQLLFRLDVQLSTEPLVPLEQIAVGGRFSVRGYQENQLVRDNGLIVSLESRLPLIRNKGWADFVQVASFVDFGRAWNTEVDTPDLTTLVSIGLGLRWAVTVSSPIRFRLQLEVYWGFRLKDVETQGDALQDKGLHLQFVIATL